MYFFNLDALLLQIYYHIHSFVAETPQTAHFCSARTTASCVRSSFRASGYCDCALHGTATFTTTSTTSVHKDYNYIFNHNYYVCHRTDCICARNDDCCFYS